MERCSFRNDEVNNLQNLLWPTSDYGGFQGPHLEYPKYIELWKNACRKFDVVVQAGGCAGLYPKLLSRDFAKVFSFEPDELNYSCLSHNCNTENIVIFNAALGEVEGICNVNQAGMDNIGMHTIELSDTGSVKVMTIDSLHLVECDFIQLDVEGFERYVLKGAIETITKFKPVISVENSNMEIEAILTPLGYKIFGKEYSDTTWRYGE